MPPATPPIPSNLTTLLSSLRAPIFLTQHNPQSLRLGTKYLRPTLRGPPMLNYYPDPLPRLRALNGQNPSNPYANWPGNDSQTLKKTLEQKGWDGEKSEMKWVSKVVPIPKVVPDGWEEVGRTGDGWMYDVSEERRVGKVARRKRIGKGAPKKGHGKRSQMGKKK